MQTQSRPVKKNSLAARLTLVSILLLTTTWLSQSWAQSVSQYSPAGSICTGVNITFQYSGSCTGTLNWRLTGGGSGTIVSTDAPNKRVTVKWTSAATDAVVNALCGSPLNQSASTSSLTITATGGSTAVSISGPSSVCSYTTATFTATPTNGGASPTYQWKVNGTVKQTSTSTTYSPSPQLSNNDVVSATITSNQPCLSTATANSNNITVTITQPSPVSVSINDPGLYCAGTVITFTATPTNGGTSPTYVWYRGAMGADNQLSGNTYRPASAFIQGEKITCKVTSNASCISGNPATSNIVTIQIQTPITPVVNINMASANLCLGTTEAFTASSTYTITSYSWKIGASAVKSTAASYTPLASDMLVPNETINLTSTVSGFCLAASSASASMAISVYLPTVAGTLAISPTAAYCNNGTPTLSVTGNTGTVTRYMSQYQDNGGAWSAWIATTATPPLTTNTGTNRVYQFQAFVQSGPACSELGTNIVSKAVNFSNSMGLLSAGPTLLCGASGSTTLTLASLSTANASWQSRYSDDGGITYSIWNTFSSSLGLSQPFTLVGISVSRIYQFQVTATNGVCVPVTSNSVQVNINPIPVATATPSNQTLYSGQATAIVLSSTVPGTTYSYSVVNSNANGTTGSGSLLAQTLTATNGTTGGTATYTITATASGCVGSQITVPASVYPVPVITAPTNRLVMSSVTLSTGTIYDTWAWKLSSNSVGLSQSTYGAVSPGTYTVIVTKNGVSISSPSFVMQGQFSGQSENYVVTNTMQVSGITQQVSPDGLPPESLSQTVQYFDGLGRPKQVVSTKGSPTKLDIAQPNVYDVYGREYRKYLPFTTNTNADGWLKNGVLDVSLNYAGPALNFYNNSSSKIAVDGAYYSETFFEPSPLNRPLQDYGPGQDWKTNSKYVAHSYQVNQDDPGAAQERVIAWMINASGLPIRSTASNSNASGGYYTTGQLNIKSTKDENGNEVREFADRQGRTILKKVQAAPSPAAINDPTQWTQTYYIYDDIGLLRYVFQPELTKSIVQLVTNQPSVNDLAAMAFQYRYDGRRRMITKKIPGADSVFMVYDLRDRLVVTQDGNQRVSNQWLVTKYDSLNRPVITGIYTPGSKFSQKAMTAQISTSKFCEAYAGSGGALHGYTNNVFPKTNLMVLSVIYYDSYSFIADLSLGTTYNYLNTEIPIDNVNVIAAQDALNSQYVVGHPTGGKMNVLGTTNYLKSAMYYDSKYRVIQTIADNNKGGTDRVTSVVDFPGRILKTKTTHKSFNPLGVAHPDQIIVHRLIYDHRSRVKQVFYTLNSNSEILLVQNRYNEIGQLLDKGLYSTNGGTSVQQSVDYRYNIRGWLSSVNNAKLTNDGTLTNDDSNDLFGMELAYNTVFPTGVTTGNATQYNGNISAMKWSQNLALGAIKDAAYNYTYDPLSRISSATYLIDNGTSWGNTGQYNESGYNYDQNGNIKGLTRNGLGGTLMDGLTYNYGTTLSNQLQYVTDGGDVTKGFVDGNISGADYKYDHNGSMTRDNNKTLDSISYNYLNLPQWIKKHNGDSLKYTYDAGGRKLKQRVYTAATGKIKITDYDGEFIYQGNAQGDTLQFISHDEGRVVMKTGTPEYQFHLKDHLGNVRLTFTTAPGQVSTIATFETANRTSEATQFLRYDDTRLVNSTLFDHTHLATTDHYAERLNGSTNEKTGLEKSLSVMPGDTIKLEVYAKYVDPTSSNWTPALTTLMSQIAAVQSGVVLDGANYSTNGNTAFPYAGLAGEGGSSGTGPKAYLNYIMFDRNFVPILTDVSQTNYVRMSTVAKETGTNVPHEKLSATIIAKQAGYIYIYLSNEETTALEVYFDDFKVTHTKSPVIQSEDFYPFGLTFNSYSRENSVSNNFKYNGKEQINDLGIDWYDYGARMYMPEIGRWGVIDPLADKMRRHSPYNYAFDNPIRFVDPDGMGPTDPIKGLVGIGLSFSFGKGGGFSFKQNTQFTVGTNVSFPGGVSAIGKVTTGSNGTSVTVGVKAETETPKLPDGSTDKSGKVSAAGQVERSSSGEVEPSMKTESSTGTAESNPTKNGAVDAAKDATSSGGSESTSGGSMTGGKAPNMTITPATEGKQGTGSDPSKLPPTVEQLKQQILNLDTTKKTGN